MTKLGPRDFVRTDCSLLHCHIVRQPRMTYAARILVDQGIDPIGSTSAEFAKFMDTDWSFPDIPTLGEAGYAEATYNFWVGLFVPSKTPAAITDRLYS